MTIQFQRAERSQRKLKIGLQGPSGSGKTLGALCLASQIVPGGKVALVDTEAGSASLYADRFTFDTISITPPYLSKKYEECIAAAAEADYDVLVIDSLSHQWVGEGGILSRKEQLDARGGSSFNNWAKFTPEQEKFKASIVNAPIHIIATLRTKQDYVLEQNSKGKQEPRKVGLAAVQREGMEYELDINFDIQMDHMAVASKDRTFLFSNTEMLDLLNEATSKRIHDWLSSAKPIKLASEDQITAILDLAKDDVERASLKSRTKGISETTANEWIEKLQSRKPKGAAA